MRNRSALALCSISIGNEIHNEFKDTSNPRGTVHKHRTLIAESQISIINGTIFLYSAKT